MKNKAAVITFPGSNCDSDCVYAVSTMPNWEVDSLWHKETTHSLLSYDLVILPGGFSYGDYLRSGSIAALSPILEKVKEYAAAGGLVLGSCNGFQILCEAKLLPGALVRNSSLSFSCRHVWLCNENKENPWTNQFAEKASFSLPIAHGEGRYIVSETEYKEMKKNGQILLTYCDEKGNSDSVSANPNGSLWNIAGVCNQKKNVFGLMPHPERATDLGSKAGVTIWNSISFALSHPQDFSLTSLKERAFALETKKE